MKEAALLTLTIVIDHGYFYLYYHWHDVFHFIGDKHILTAFCLCMGVIFPDAQLLYALGTVIYIQLEGLMNGKAMHVMSFS